MEGIDPHGDKRAGSEAAGEEKEAAAAAAHGRGVGAQTRRRPGAVMAVEKEVGRGHERTSAAMVAE